MKHPLRLALVGGIVALSVFAAAPAGAAEAADTPTNPWAPPPSAFTTAQDLSAFMIDVHGAALFDSMPAYAKAAWSKQYAAQAAQNAGMYRAGLIYGNVDAEHLASVTPIADPTYTLPRTPAFSASKFLKPTAPDVGAATAAATAFAMRSDIADGVTSWMGVDANGAVCGDPVAGGDNFINFITGQDCSIYRQAEGTTVNADVSTATFGGLACNVAGTYCLQLIADIYTYSHSGSGTYTPIHVYCLKTTGTGSSVSFHHPGAPSWSSAGVSTGVTNGTPIGGPHWVCPAAASGSYQDTIGAQSSTILANMVPAPTWDNYNAYFAGAYPGTGNRASTTTPDPDPLRTLKCTYTFSNGSSANASTAGFRESAGAYPAPICPVVPSGLTLTHMKVEEISAGIDNVLQDEDTTDSYQDHAAADQALCSTQACILDLQDLTNGVSCFSEGDTCDGWLTDPDRDTKYACEYGGQADDIQDCYVYAQVFNTASRLAGAPYADPHTGEDTGGQTGFSEDQQNLQRPAESPDDVARNCFGGTYSAFNPLEWVVKPIQCGLEWAFVPSSVAVQDAAENMTHDWDDHAPGQLATMVANWHFDLTASGCSRSATLNLGFGGPQTFDVWNFCPGSPAAAVAPWSRALLDAGCAVGAIVAIRRAIAGTVDYKGQ
ncbi:MAG TPA: hypothetical protein VGM70_08895 [Pseudolysinimonas sp.]|jgi:hypothetical protein